MWRVARAKASRIPEECCRKQCSKAAEESADTQSHRGGRQRASPNSRACAFKRVGSEFRHALRLIGGKGDRLVKGAGDTGGFGLVVLSFRGHGWSFPSKLDPDEEAWFALPTGRWLFHNGIVSNTGLTVTNRLDR